eukprot:TRINITY_DN48886_c0_g1_i1.p1 TRINITY_DN48886_c0_g1~~TRINITY_DN48886_c0_g1_i1.p1  ORF type:complete len:345 (-),score=46.24 TRINITY_DN48886_c0_g1_i1:84-1118(-)
MRGDAMYQTINNGEIDPLLEKEHFKPRSVFVTGHRIRMNVVALFLNCMIPFAVYVLCNGVTCFCTAYNHPLRAYLVLVSCGVLCVALWMMALYARWQTPNPTWYTYLAITTSIAYIVGVMNGMNICQQHVMPYLELTHLRSAKGIDTSTLDGTSVMDAGALEFVPGTKLDESKSWHFKLGTLYCVAPVVTNGLAPETQSYDYWVVGKNCCGMGSSDFRCGSWIGKGNRSGLRVLDDHDLGFYRLAVQQAETTYDIRARHPVFFTWSDDPILELKIWNMRVFRNYLIGVAVAFCTSAFFVCIATFSFSWIGRGSWDNREAYDRSRLQWAEIQSKLEDEQRLYDNL